MAAPPSDANPEHFITGKGHYDNLRVAVARDTPDEFRIDPVPFPWLAIILWNLVFVAFFVGLHLLMRDIGQLHVPAWFVPIGMALIVCVLFTAFASWRFLTERRRGAWLIFDKTTQVLHLPREKEQFTLDEIIHLQYITTKRLDYGGEFNNDACSELNLVTCRNGERRRWHLLGSIGNIGSIFGHILRPLVKHTPIPVVRIRDSWRGGWDVTVTPWHK